MFRWGVGDLKVRTPRGEGCLENVEKHARGRGQKSMKLSVLTF